MANLTSKASVIAVFLFFLQTEIAKRLNAILAQVMPFLSQEVSLGCGVAAGELIVDRG